MLALDPSPEMGWPSLSGHQFQFTIDDDHGFLVEIGPEFDSMYMIESRDPAHRFRAFTTETLVDGNWVNAAQRG
ncbi:hypothetical protein [Micromonospora sp. NPDC051296]|uniref:hypothetical protein n=1 Tax=Micromonospora sp. NPDC051296 TaxID=3155046 RepID=UPI0034396D68